MIFSHDTEPSLLRLVELVNSAYDSGALAVTDPASLTAFAVRHQVSHVPAVGPHDVSAVTALRAELRAVFDETDDATGGVVLTLRRHLEAQKRIFSSAA